MEKPICIMLVHGFGGGIAEISPLADLLSHSGYKTHMVKLAGHVKENSKHIDNISYKEWISSARKDYKKLSLNYDVVAVGFSMGGLICTVLNRENPFKCIIYINTPIYPWNFPQICKNLFNDFKATMMYYLKSGCQVTLYTSIQFLRLTYVSAGLMGKVKCPTLIVQAKDDDSVWMASAGYIFKKVQGKKTMYFPKEGGHRVLLNPKECQAITKLIEQTICEM